MADMLGNFTVELPFISSKSSYFSMIYRHLYITTNGEYQEDWLVAKTVAELAH